MKIAKMKILVISDVLPYPPDSGDRIRIFNLFKRLAESHEIQLISLLYDKQEYEHIRFLERLFSKVIPVYCVPKPFIKHLPGLWKFGLRGIPFELYFKYQVDVQQAIREISKEFPYNILQVEHSTMAFYLRYHVPRNDAHTVIDQYDIVYDQAKRIAHYVTHPLVKARYWLFSYQMRHWEPRYVGRYDLCLCASQNDQQKLHKINPRLNVKILPNGVDTKEIELIPERKISPNFLFIGKMHYYPSVDAVKYFIQSVFPLIENKYPNAKFFVIGRNPPKELITLSRENIFFTGYVENLRPYYENAGVVVTPLRSGSGTRLKILEAMAMGKPVVTTSIGCEGLAVQDGVHLYIADSPEDFVRKIDILLTNKAVRRSIIFNARKLVVDKYDWDVITQQLQRYYDDLKEMSQIIQTR